MYAFCRLGAALKRSDNMATLRTTLSPAAQARLPSIRDRAAVWKPTPTLFSSGSRLSAQNLSQAVEVEDFGEALFLHHGGGEGGFFFLEGADFLLDRIGGEQPIGDHGARLADAVRAIYRLRFDGGIPPRVAENDVAGGGEI